MGQKLMIRHTHVGAVAVVALSLLSFIKQQKVMVGIYEQPPSSSPSQKQKQRLIRPKIYKVDEMPQIASSGPYVLNPSLPGRNMSGGKGLYQFDDVCLTKHFKTQAIQGLIYLEPKNEKLVNKIYRCVPCSRPLHHDGGWWGVGRDQNSVGHICGFQGKKGYCSRCKILCLQATSLFICIPPLPFQVRTPCLRRTFLTCPHACKRRLRRKNSKRGTNGIHRRKLKLYIISRSQHYPSIFKRTSATASLIIC